MDRRRYLATLGVGGALGIGGCVGAAGPTDDGGDGVGSVVLATATTPQDSGLLGEVLPAFEERFGASVRTVARGTGASLRLGRQGDCDLVLAHARSLEDEFLRSGAGINRRALMANDFVIVGPPADPAGAAGDDPVGAFRAIADAGATFLSRGDRSGTDVTERRIWDRAGIEPGGSWYRETGQGMGSTLVRAGEIGAYTLSDRGTFLSVREETGLVAHVDRGIEDPPAILRNEYGIIPVDPAVHDVNYGAAMALVGHLTGRAQAQIRSFRLEGQRAFLPAALSGEPRFSQYVPSDWSP